MLAGMTIGSGAVAAEKSLSPTVVPAGYLPEHTLPAKAMAYAQVGQIIRNRIWGDDKRTTIWKSSMTTT